MAEKQCTVHNEGFTAMPNHHLRDKELSLKAKGLLSFMLALPPDWDYSIAGLASCNQECRSTIGSIINELIEKGYVNRIQRRDSGMFGGAMYDVFGYPVFLNGGDNPFASSPWINYPSTVNSSTDSLAQINTNKINTKEISKELDKSNSCRETRQSVSAEFVKEVVEYLNQKTGKHYHPTTAKTKRCISARWREGFHNIEDYKKVIDKKYAQWSNDLKMCVYIRPETLFGTKFEGYLNEVTQMQSQRPTIRNTLPDMTDEEAERLRREMYGES